MGESGWKACNMPQLVEQVAVACILMVIDGLGLNVVRWHVTCHNLLNKQSPKIGQHTGRNRQDSDPSFRHPRMPGV